MAHKNAASVLPEPVGATTSVSSPLPIARHAPAWACVGSANAPSNHARVAGENPSSASVSVIKLLPHPFHHIWVAGTSADAIMLLPMAIRGPAKVAPFS